MLAEIVLPAGTDRVTIRGVPELFANAIHPALPDDTPRRITELKKYPLTEEYSRQWCGEGCRPFPVSLTADDMAELSRSAWKLLPPLVLPIDESDWQPYRDAFEKKPPKDWRLDELLQNRVLNTRILWHSTVDEYLTEVKQAAMRGHLEPRSSATLRPMPGAMGEQLQDSFVTLENFTSFAARFDVGVMVADATPKPTAPPVGTANASDGVEPDKAGPVPVEQGLSTKDIAACFGECYYSADNWPKRLSGTAWLETARIERGEAGGASAVWNPLTLAQLMHSKTKGDKAKEKLMKALNSRFTRNPVLGPWRDAFNEYFATHCATD